MVNKRKVPETTGPGVAQLERELQAFVDRVAHRLPADVVTLYLYDAERDKFYLPIGHGVMDQATFKHAMPRSDHVAGKVVRGRQPIIADDARTHPDMSGPFTFRERVESAAGFPIVLAESVAGVLFISYRQRHTFTAETEQAVRALLQEVAGILVSARLAEVRQRLASVVPQEAVADRSLDFIVKSACTVTNVPLALWVLKPAAGTLSIRAATGLRSEFAESASVELAGDSFIAQVVHSGDPLMIADLASDSRFPFRSELEHAGWQSLLAVPVRAAGRVLGVLAMLSFAGRDFAQWERNLLMVLAERAGDALLEERRSQALARLHDIGLALTSQLELSEVLQRIVASAIEVFGADIVTLYLYDHQAKAFTQAVALDVRGEADREPLPGPRGVAALIVQQGEAILADDAEHDGRMSRGFIERYGVKSSAGFPLRAGDEVVGVLFINYRTPYQFLEDDRELIALFANQAALAIRNARLFQAEQRQAAAERRRAAMATIATTFSERLDRETTLQAIVSGAQELTRATNSSLFLYDTESRSFKLGAESTPRRPKDRQPRSEGGLAWRILTTDEPVLIEDARQARNIRQEILEEGVRSIMGVPVRVEGVTVGVLFVHAAQANHFDAGDMDLLQSLADYGAMAIERTRWLEAISKINEATGKILGLDELVTELLGKIVHQLSFQLAAVQLINREQNSIETVDGINAPWAGEAWHKLDSGDIQADVVQTGRTEVIAGYDPRFDRRLYDRFGHEKLVRIFTPIVAGSEVLGTAEAGFERERTPEISPGKQEALKALVAGYTPRLAEAMLAHVLQVIVANAVSLMRADSGSIHVLYQPAAKRYVYQACAGRIGLEFLEAYPPSEGGIGQQSLARRELLCIDDPDKLWQTHPGIYAPRLLWGKYPQKYKEEEGVRAIASCPLLSGEREVGVLYVHFWHKHSFSADERGWLKLFGDQAAAAIQKAQFYEKLRDRSRALASLSMIGQSLLSELNLGNLLEQIAQKALDVLKADIVTIYQYHQDRRSFATPPTMKGELLYPRLMRTSVEPGDAPWQIVREGRSSYAPNARSDFTMCDRVRKRPAEKGPPFVDREGIESSAGILLRVRQEIVGVMFVNYRHRREFTDSERRVIEGFATYAAIAIRIARLVEQDMTQQLKDIQVIDRKISSTLDLDRVLDLIVSQSMKHLRVDGYGVLQLFDESSRELVTRAQKNLPSDQANLRLPITGAGITARVARSKRPALVPDVRHKRGQGGLRPDVRSQLAVPLVLKGRLIGVLDLESRSRQAFKEADLSFLKLLADQAVVAIQNARYVQELCKVLQSIPTSTELRAVLEQIAESAIALLDADDAVILPYRSEAGEFIAEQAVHRGRATVRSGSGAAQPGGIAYQVLQQGILKVPNAADPPAGMDIAAAGGLLGEIGPQAFVGVALKGPEHGSAEALGVLFVAYNNAHQFPGAELDLVQAFASQAAIAIQIVRQEEQRRKADTLAAVNAFGANFVHTVRNLLGPIPICFDRLKGTLAAGDQRTVSRWLPPFEASVQNLERILQAAGRLRPSKPRAPQPLDVNDAIEQALRTVEVPSNVRHSLELAPGLPPVLGSREDLLDLFANLIDNACKAMPGGGQLRLHSELQTEAANGQRWVVVRVEDTGVGMDEAVRAQIFEPFFTHRPDGLGLGLWLVQVTVQQIGGEILVASELGRGTTFTIRLPAAVEAR